jgi:predicted dehydrogenase
VKAIKVVVVGLGYQNMRFNIPAISRNPFLYIDAVCDVDDNRLAEVTKNLDIKGFTSLEAMLNERTPDCAVVALPHHEYEPALRLLLSKGIHVFKEKPLARSVDEATRIIEIATTYGAKIFIPMRRRFNSLFRYAKSVLPLIEPIIYFDAYHALNIARLDSGWRASQSMAGGGVLIDLGYHYVDLLLWLFGRPTSLEAGFLTGSRTGQQYDVEDTAQITFTYELNENRKSLGRLMVSRVATLEEERLHIVGERGSILVTPSQLDIRDAKGVQTERLQREGAWPSQTDDQVEEFRRAILGEIPPYLTSAQQHLDHLRLLENAYAGGR